VKYKMVKQRGHGEGSIYQRKDGRWVASITLENRKRKQFYGKTRKEVQEKLRVALNEQRQGTLATGPQQTLKQYLEYWLEDVHKPAIRLSSYMQYRGILDKHIFPLLGHIQVQKLTPQQVQSFYARKEKEGLALGTIRTIHAVLHNALSHAVSINLVSRNVSDVVNPPRLVKHERHPLTIEQAQKLLQHVQGHSLEGLITVALATGMRRGELLGLRWQDIHFDTKSLQIQRTISRQRKKGIVESEPKTSRGRRNIILPPFAIEALKEHRTRQLEVRLKVGSAWEESNFVFCNGHGGFLEPSQLHMMFRNLLKEADLPQIRFHDLRHSAATMMLTMGVHPKVVQELLGHSSISLTLDTYSHVLPSMQQEAMDKLDALFGGSKQDGDDTKGKDIAGGGSSK
jgi:integrase